MYISQSNFQANPHLLSTLHLYRSLSGVIEQMEQFSSRLGELSSRVESTHEHTAHGLEQGARHRDEQLRSTYIHTERSEDCIKN